MKSLNYWQQFTNTGKIEDYLSYVDRNKSAEDKEVQHKDYSGVNPYAGVHMCDRNDIETGAYRGV